MHVVKCLVHSTRMLLFLKKIPAEEFGCVGSQSLKLTLSWSGTKVHTCPVSSIQQSHLQKECTGHAAPLLEIHHRLPDALGIKPWSLPLERKAHLTGPLPSALRTLIGPTSSFYLRSIHMAFFLPSEVNSKAPVPAVGSPDTFLLLCTADPHATQTSMEASPRRPACPSPCSRLHWHFLIFFAASTTMETTASFPVCIFTAGLLH